MSRRPLGWVSFWALTNMFGLNIQAFSVTLIALHVLAALQIYWLLCRLELGSRGIALAIALLFMVYPADYTHMWLIMINIWVPMNLLLIYAHLLLSFAITGAIWALLVAAALLLISLGIYEAQLGVAFVWALLLFWVKRDIPHARKVLLITPLAIGLGFAAWRILGAPAAGVADPYIHQLQFSPSALLERLWIGGTVLFVWSWVVPVLQGLGIQSIRIAWAIIAALVGLFWLVVAFSVHQIGIDKKQQMQISWKNVKRSSGLVAVGLVVTVAGYLPSIFVIRPSLYSTASRVNLYPSIGASVVTAAVLYLVSSLLRRNQTAAGLLTLAGLVPLIALGVATQVLVQKDSQVAWQEQKDIWQSMFLLCSDFADDTAVYLILPGFDDREQGRYGNWRRPPFDSQWEIAAGLQVLYENRSLRGDILYPDLSPDRAAPELTMPGMVDGWTHQLTPFNKIVFLRYDGTPRRLRLVKDIQAEFYLPWEPVGYIPEVRCLSGSTPDIELRRLVADGE